MNIRIVCIGKLKEKYWQGAEAEYLKRLSSYAKVEIAELKESPSDDVNEEGERIVKILGAPKNDEFIITLEIKGKSLDSEGLAAKINDLAIEGKSNITFIIGGSNGLSPEVSALADFKLSFSAMTFPHQMMRVILLEQIYRSFKIIRGEKYHK
ncbi:MAG: 23S rRNA (pseudouridine(1915)-N(3))-methyltransferase RlmH [Firmicutes bacterium]|nr:23S rRNA (pseudouridine(1915)-N(3))-methyltransferase RlmH [Bacillota bacterium]